NIAFWLIQHSVGIARNPPNPAIYGTEIDAFEYHRAAGTDSLYYNLHWNGYNFSDGTHRAAGIAAYLPGVSTGFHIFGFEWTPKEYIFYVDGRETGRMNVAISHTEEFILFSTEINGFGGDRFQMSKTIPDSLEVDYLKVYARKPSVTVYGSCDYQGWVLPSLKAGDYNLPMLTSLGLMNDDASSIEIPVGWVVTAYEHDNFTGDSVVVTSDSRCAGNFDNKLSSLRITSP
ncbi:MAG: family 16 glycosylhydrolase, partial [Ferruginibacter sp.]